MDVLERIVGRAFCKGVLVLTMAAIPCQGQSTSKSGAGEQEERLAAFRELVDRQGAAWEKNDFSLGKSDWLPIGFLSSPGGRIPATQLAATIAGYHKNFTELHVVVKNVFLSADGNQAAIEWDWVVTRRRDGKQGLTHDAILVTLVGGKIASWREYFDFGDSVDAQP